MNGDDDPGRGPVLRPWWQEGALDGIDEALRAAGSAPSIRTALDRTA